MEKLRKKLVLFSVMLGLLLASAVPAVAQAPGGEGTCFFSAVEGGYLCTFRPSQNIDALCPADEPAEKGDTLDCRSFETDERFTCTVVEVIDPGLGFVIRISCEPFEEEPPLGEEEPPPDNIAGVPGEPFEITQELEQEAESGEIDQSFEVS